MSKKKDGKKDGKDSDPAKMARIQEIRQSEIERNQIFQSAEKEAIDKEAQRLDEMNLKLRMRINTLSEQMKEMTVDKEEVLKKVNSEISTNMSKFNQLEQQVEQYKKQQDTVLERIVKAYLDAKQRQEDKLSTDLQDRKSKISNLDQQLQTFRHSQIDHKRTSIVEQEAQYLHKIQELQKQFNDQKDEFRQEIIRLEKNFQKLRTEIKERNDKQIELIQGDAKDKAQALVKQMEMDLRQKNSQIKKELTQTDQEMQTKKHAQSVQSKQQNKIQLNVALNEDNVISQQELNLKQEKKIAALKEKVNFMKDFISKQVTRYTKEIQLAKLENDSKEAQLQQQTTWLNEYLKELQLEYRKVKNLAMVTTGQRAAIETFFIDSIAQLRERIKGEEKERFLKLPSIDNNNQQSQSNSDKPLLLENKNYEQSLSPSNKKVDIGELDLEEKEKVLRILYFKINQGTTPLPWQTQSQSQQKINQSQQQTQNNATMSVN